jgi:uncharacterized membrane protein
MDLESRHKAQQRVDRIGAFRAELAALEHEQALVLTPEQRARMEVHLATVLGTLTTQYGADATESGRRISWGMRVAALLGGAALIAAVVLFLHRIWGFLPGAAQFVVLLAVPLGLLAAAGAARRRGVDAYYVSLLALAAGTSFVLGLTTLGTIYNSVPTPHALLAWGLFALATSYALRLRLLLGIGLALLCSYVGALGMTIQGYYWPMFLQRSEYLLPAAALVYAVPWLRRGTDAEDFGFVYRATGAGISLLALLILSTVGHVCCSGLGISVAKTVFQLAGLALSAVIVVHGIRLGRNGLVNLGAAGFVVFLYVRLHAWCWDWMPKYLFFLMLGLTAIVLLAVFRRLRRRLAGGSGP